MDHRTRIALVESDDLIRELMIRWLDAAGYAPVVTRLEDVAEIRSGALVIANVASPRSAGALVDQLRAVGGAPILLVSARFRRGLARSGAIAGELGVAAVLPKPFSREEFLAAVRRLVPAAGHEPGSDPGTDLDTTPIGD